MNKKLPKLGEVDLGIGSLLLKDTKWHSVGEIEIAGLWTFLRRLDQFRRTRSNQKGFIRCLSTLLIIFVLGFSCTDSYAQKIVQLAKQGVVSQMGYAKEIPFRYEKKHIFIDVTINGKIYNFLFDTGFDFTAIDLKYVQDLEYKKVTKKSGSGSSFKKHKIQFVEIPKVEISDIAFSGIGAALLDLSFINENYPCSEHPVAGVIGANLMHHANWKIDYAHQLIKFSDDFKHFDIPESSKIIDMLSKGWGSKRVEVVINGISKEFILDTGSGGRITTGVDFFEVLKANDAQVEYERITKGNQWKGETTYENHKVWIQHLDIGSLNMRYEIISLEKGVSSLIGNRLLEDFTVFINWVENKLILAPIKVLDPAVLEGYDLLLKPDFATNKIVISGHYTTAVSDPNFMIGTPLVAINGINVSNLTTDELCTFWNDEWPSIGASDEIVIDTENSEMVLERKQFLPRQ